MGGPQNEILGLGESELEHARLSRRRAPQLHKPHCNDAALPTDCGVARAGSRWLFEPFANGLLHELVVAKDNYETPAWIWKHYVARESLTVDVQASALNAGAPTYVNPADPTTALDGLRSVGLWLNPAFRLKCTAIEPTLERILSTAVAERGCWLVALLPVYSFKTW